MAFLKRAVVSISASGLQVTVEEARSLLGEVTSMTKFRPFISNPQGIAYIPKQMFDEEYTYHSSSSEDSQQADETTLPDTFEIRLDALLECLNIFGSAGSSSASSNLSSLQQRGRGGWKGRSGEDGEARGGSRFRDEFKGGAGEGKGTAMRMTYGGNGYPLTVLL
jgi:cell cycle checkpoint protein